MAIIAKATESKFTPAPEGLHQAVCIDVVDLGLKNTPWGDKHKVELRWQLEIENPDTHQPFQVRSQYTLSLSEKATLRQRLETWRGRKFTDQELTGFDLEKLIGINCQLQVIHNLSDEGRTFANVQAIVPHNSKLPKIAAQDYVREQDRAKTQGNGQLENEPPFEEDPIPF